MDIPVDFLLEKLTQLVRYHVDLIGGAKNDLEQLNNELRSLKAVLKDASRKSRKDEVFKEWERQIREAVYDVEDAIDTCITEMAAEKTKNVLRRTVGKANRISLAKLVRSLREEKVQPLIQDSRVKFANLVISDMPADTAALATKDIRQKRRQNKIVGVEDETNTLINALNDPSDKLEVISIIGMPGLGKTTVAWKIYQDPRIKFEFSTLIWVNISEDPNIMKVLRTILKKFTSNIPNDISKEELVDMVKTKLEVGKFMIVMDDVWTKDSWDELKSFLPKSNNMGRVLITSREKKVAYHANPMRKPHKLRFLTKDESWELLQYEVYDEINSVHKDLVQAGQVIAKQCDGLPLSIIVIGGILKDKISEVGGVLTSLKDEWEDVSKSIETYLVYGDKTRRLENIINLSYVKLPYEVRDCFLYLGVFPEDVDIPVKKLILLWIAEGFIQEIPKKSVEEVAQENLMELINRNLIMVEKTKPDGEAKICRVHDTIRQFCRTEAKFENLNLFQEISKNQGVFEPALDSIQKYRRLCIHSHVYDFFTKRPKVPKSRTFLCSPQDSINLTAKDIAPVTEAFQLIRVLDAEKLRFPRFPTKLLQLIHLRYLTLAFDNDQANTLPEPMSSLWNLQTLIVDIPSKTLEVKVDIWIMRHLRHFKTKTAIVLRGDGKGEGGENLQTLSRLSPESCTNHVFDKAKNLITLGIQGDLSFLLESKCLEKLNRLNKLKLVHQVQQGAADKPLPRLPEQHRFPPNLKILVLANTYLSWEHMSVLARLNFLKVLKLKDNAFTGNSWKVASGEFQNLTMLSIERLNVMFWTASIDSFPKLGFLLLTNCENLNEVPFEACKNLEMLYMERVTQSAVTSAVKIKKARQAEAANGEEFVLNIAPADNVPAS